MLARGLTAVIAFNDLMALGVISRLAVRGVVVPDEVSVVGFDNIPMAGMVTPHITTVALPTEMSGRVAVELLIEQLSHPNIGIHEEMLGAQLIVRASTGPVPSDLVTGVPRRALPGTANPA